MIEKKERKPTEQAWGTKKELAWIETIGDTANKSQENPTNEPKTKFLSGYIKSCAKRVQWGEGANKIDKDVCLKLAQELLGKAKNGY